MRNFVYLSEAQVESLYTRIPRGFVQGLTGDASTPSRFGHALAAEQFLETQGKLGGPTDGLEFMRGIQPFGYGLVDDYSQEVAYFGGQIGTTWVFLIGPRAGMIPEMESITTGGRLEATSVLTHRGLKSINQLIRSEETGELPKATQIFDSKLVLGLREGVTLFPPAPEPLLYVAKTLHRVRTANESLVLATPIFVAAPPEAPKKETKGGGWLGKLFGR